MAHESFEDLETAKLMNQYFVNIKVDREERPDLDKIYQTTHQILTRQAGGWPLTIFLSPQDLVPFFSGTYFPLEKKYHLPAFKDVLHMIANAYQNQSEHIELQNKELINILKDQVQKTQNEVLDDQPLQQALLSLRHQYDTKNGGFGNAPKFPQATKLLLVLQKDPSFGRYTLQKMAEGGIYDQIAGGFFRYSVDAEWQIPHFEKMLYDNAELLQLYAMASSDSPLFQSVTFAVATWIVSNMQAEEGGYFSSLDADSEGHEGKYYVWQVGEIRAALTDAEYAVVKHYYGLESAPNFEGHWHLHVAYELKAVANQLQESLTTVEQLLFSARQKLLSRRKERISPHLDNKILTSWNALMIKGMLLAGDKLNEPLFIDSAKRALHFLITQFRASKALSASYQSKTHLSAYLDDYAFLADALLTFIQIEWNTTYLQAAKELVETLLLNFNDEHEGGFFFTGKNHEKLLYRPKTYLDEAIPSGNGILTQVLLLLGWLLGEPRYLTAAEKTFTAAYPTLLQFPAEHGSLLLALDSFLHPPKVVIIRSPKNEVSFWRSSIDYNKKNIVFIIPNEEKELPDNLQLKVPTDSLAAYICQGTECLKVMTDKTELQRILNE